MHLGKENDANERVLESRLPQHLLAEPVLAEAHEKAAGPLLKLRLGKPLCRAELPHLRRARPPCLNKACGVERLGEQRIPRPRQMPILQQLRKRNPWRQFTWVGKLDLLVIDANLDVADDGVITMDQGVDEGLLDSGERVIPYLSTARFVRRFA